MDILCIYISYMLFVIRAVMARSQTGQGPGTGYPVNLCTTIGLLFGQFICIQAVIADLKLGWVPEVNIYRISGKLINVFAVDIRQFIWIRYSNGKSSSWTGFRM